MTLPSKAIGAHCEGLINRAHCLTDNRLFFSSPMLFQLSHIDMFAQCVFEREWALAIASEGIDCTAGVGQAYNNSSGPRLPQTHCPVSAPF